MTSSQVCVDSNLALKLVLVEEDSQLARALWGHFSRHGTEIVAPLLLLYEVTSVLRNEVFAGRLSVERGWRGLDVILALGIVTEASLELHQQAWELATGLGLPNAYDAHYLALAQSLGCQFWTADGRLHRAVSRDLPWVTLLSQDAGRVLSRAGRHTGSRDSHGGVS